MILLITTRDIPVNNEDYKLMPSTNTLEYILNNMLEPDNVSLKDYLSDFDAEKHTPEEVLSFLNGTNKDSIPIFYTKTDNNISIFITLCLDKKRSGYGDVISQDYITAILKDINQYNNINQDDDIYILAHCLDIVMSKDSKGLRRIVNNSEIQTGNLKKENIHLRIFQHEGTDASYKLILQLGKDIHIDDLENRIKGLWE